MIHHGLFKSYGMIFLHIRLDSKHGVRQTQVSPEGEVLRLYFIGTIVVIMCDCRDTGVGPSENLNIP